MTERLKEQFFAEKSTAIERLKAKIWTKISIMKVYKDLIHEVSAANFTNYQIICRSWSYAIQADAVNSWIFENTPFCLWHYPVKTVCSCCDLFCFS